MQINAVNVNQLSQTIRSASETTEAKDAGFSGIMEQALTSVAETEQAAQAEQAALLTGESDSIHSVVLAAEKADLALQLTMQIRNKVLDAYTEVMRMQI